MFCCSSRALPNSHQAGPAGLVRCWALRRPEGRSGPMRAAGSAAGAPVRSEEKLGSVLRFKLMHTMDCLQRREEKVGGSSLTSLDGPDREASLITHCREWSTSATGYRPRPRPDHGRHCVVVSAIRPLRPLPGAAAGAAGSSGCVHSHIPNR
jgi:hypothetical protein